MKLHNDKVCSAGSYLSGWSRRLLLVELAPVLESPFISDFLTGFVLYSCDRNYHENFTHYQSTLTLNDYDIEIYKNINCFKVNINDVTYG